jgi:hypothetical protein
VVDKVELGQVFLGVIRVSPVSIIHSLLRFLTSLSKTYEKQKGATPGKIQSNALPDTGKHKALNIGVAFSLLSKAISSPFSSRGVSGSFEGAGNCVLVFTKRLPYFCPTLLKFK